MNILLILLSSLFLTANTHYAEGNYVEAAAMYEEILQTEPSAEVYYNLGNAYYKQGELAKSIISYERALRIKPFHEDAKYNLKLAQARIVDNVKETQSFFLSNWMKAVRNTMNVQTWTWISIVAFHVMLVGFFVFAFSKKVVLRKSAFYMSILVFVLSIFAFANAYSLHKRDKDRAEAIVTQGVVNVKSSPDQSGTELFTIHEGTKVVISDELEGWYLVTVGNNIGWMPLSELERI
jgi:tetratricopeptide (TPR) repeat protein